MEDLHSIWGIISFSPSDNFCENALDLSNGKLTVHNNWPVGTYCQWLIYAVDDEHYVNLEFQNLDVRIAELDDLPGLIVLPIFLFRSHTGWIGLIGLIFMMDLMNSQ